MNGEVHEVPEMRNEMPDKRALTHQPMPLLFAALWILLPAIQYLGAYQRTIAVTEKGTTLGALGTADLSVWYIYLVVTTALFILWRSVLKRPIGLDKNGCSQ